MKMRRGRENPVLELHEAHHAGPHQEDSCLASWGSGCRTEAAPALPRSPESQLCSSARPASDQWASAVPRVP